MNFLKSIKLIVPLNLRIRFANRQIRKKYDVVFKKGSTAGRNTVFEGKNLLNVNSQVYSSYVGFGTYISGNTKFVKAKIGKFCSIGQNVRNHFGLHPSSDFVSTHPSFFSTKKQAGFTFVKENFFQEHQFIDSENKYTIRIGNDVWIGNDVSIMDGVKIGDGAIIATGSVVTKDVDPYSIVGGVPAKLIRMRFSEKEIEFLLNFKWWDRDLGWIEANSKYFRSIKEFYNRNYINEYK